MLKCDCCGNPKSQFILNARKICFQCDGIWFEIEMECDQEEALTDGDVLEIVQQLGPRPKIHKHSN